MAINLNHYRYEGLWSESGYQNVVISVDGQRLNNIDMSRQLIGSIDINSIERIEIAKGTGSVKIW